MWFLIVSIGGDEMVLWVPKDISGYSVVFVTWVSNMCGTRLKISVLNKRE